MEIKKELKITERKCTSSSGKLSGNVWQRAATNGKKISSTKRECSDCSGTPARTTWRVFNTSASIVDRATHRTLHQKFSYQYHCCTSISDKPVSDIFGLTAEPKATTKPFDGVQLLCGVFSSFKRIANSWRRFDKLWHFTDTIWKHFSKQVRF